MSTNIIDKGTKMRTKQAKPKRDEKRALNKIPANEDPAPENENLPIESRGTRLPRVKISNNKAIIGHPDDEKQLMHAFGTDNRDFMAGTIKQLVNAAGSRGRPPDETDTNFLLSGVAGLKPQDPFETMLLTQSVAVHMATMRSANHLAHAEDIIQRESAERIVSKLSRAFLNLMDGLKRYRAVTAAITVQNVQVQDGGRAIVGNITQNAPAIRSDQPPVSPPAISDARAVPMEIIGEREPTPVLARRKART